MNFKNYGILDRGVPINIPVTVTTAGGKPLDLTGQDIYFTIKPKEYDFDRDDRNSYVAKCFKAQSPKVGQFIIELSAKDMDFEPGSYYFDIVIGGWRAINTSFTLAGGPTNRNILDEEDKKEFSTIGKGIQIIQRPERPIVILTELDPFLKSMENEILEEAYGKIDQAIYYPIKIKKVLQNEEEYNYLYETWFDKLDYDFAKEYYKSNLPKLGACSSIRVGDYHGRSYDWYYSEEAEFIVHTPRRGPYYASVGVAGGISDLTKYVVERGIQDPLLKLIPFSLLDGINEKGLVANINVVSTEKGYRKTSPDGRYVDTINALMLVRYVLDNFESAEEAVNFIKDHISVEFPKLLLDHDYTIHMMVSDKAKTYVLEFVDGKNVVIENNIMTNFHLYEVIFNSDGSVYTPETKDAKHDAIKTNRITPLGSGLERYNLLIANKNIGGTRTGMRTLIDMVKYSRAYLSSPNPPEKFWHTECVGDNKLTVVSDPEDFAEVEKVMDEMYQKRNRSEKNTWQTVHSTVYDLTRNKLYIKTQEQDNELAFEI